MINLGHELVQLTDRIDEVYLDDQLSPFYAKAGRPAVARLLLVRLHLLKSMYTLSD